VSDVAGSSRLRLFVQKQETSTEQCQVEACLWVSLSPVEGTVDIPEGQLRDGATSECCLLPPPVRGPHSQNASDFQLLSTFPVDWKFAISQLETKSGHCRA
ncbi:hypothetical protein D4764_01G0004110, partial [Takifugu flavidus]